MKAWLGRAWAWAHGEMTEPRLQDRSLGLLTCIGLVGGLLVYLDLNIEIRKAPLVRGMFRGGAFLGLGMATALGWHLWSTARSSRAVNFAGVTAICLAAVPLLVRLSAGVQFFRCYAFLVLGAGWLGILSVRLLGTRTGLDWESWGMTRGDWRWWLPRTAALVAIIVPVAALALVWDEPMAEFYPWYRPAREFPLAFARAQMAVVIDFLGWEALFRGFLLFGLARRGDVHLAVWAQALVFFIAHQGKPELEFILSLPGGVLAGYFAWRARSFVPLWIMHAVQLLTANAVGVMLRGGFVGDG